MAVTYEQLEAIYSILEADNTNDCIDFLLTLYAEMSLDNAQYLLNNGRACDDCPQKDHCKENVFRCKRALFVMLGKEAVDGETD